MRHILPLVLLGLPSLALAVDGDPFDSSGSLIYGEGTLQGESPVVLGNGPALGLNANVTEDLVVGRHKDGSSFPILGSSLSTTIQGSWTIEDTLRIDLHLPLYPNIEVDPLDQTGLGYSGRAFGDAHLQGVVPFFSNDTGALSLAAIGGVGLPTGNADALIRRGLHADLALALGGEVDPGLGYVVNLGATLSQSDALAGVSLGSTIDTVVGAWYRVDDGFRVGAEAQYLGGLANSTGQRNDVDTYHLFAQTHADNGVSMTIGGGLGGFLSGVGSPDWRAFASLAWAPTVRDQDGDGLSDGDDVCPADREDVDGFEDMDGCPDLDNDMDGIADLADSCTDEAEDPDGFADSDGCPDLDNDADGFLDTEDACPDDAGTAEGCPDLDNDGIRDTEDACPEAAGPLEYGGCPDADGDGVPDAQDACPDQARPADEVLAISDGCPKDLYFGTDGLVQAEPLTFSSGRSSLTSSQRKALEPVAELIKATDKLVKLEIAGHTDGREGNAEALSQQRADKVLAHLVELGVPAERLVARGLAGARPVDTNRTSTGRAKNRRVSYEVLETSEGEATLDVQPEQPASLLPQPEDTLAPGTLTVDLHGSNFANVYLDGRKLAATAPFKDVKIDPGRHTLLVSNPSQGVEHEQIIFVNGESILVEVGEASEGHEGPWEGDEPPPAPPVETEPEAPPAETAPPEGDPWAVPWLDEEGEGQATEPEAAEPEKKKKKKRKKKKRKKKDEDEAPPEVAPEPVVAPEPAPSEEPPSDGAPEPEAPEPSPWD